MRQPESYELTFPHPGRDDPDMVVVHRTQAAGPGGNAVYADDSGILRAEINGDGEVRMIASGGRQALVRPTRVRALG